MTVLAAEETLEQFRLRARRWLAANMPRVDPDNPPQYRLEETSDWERARALQRRLYAGGFAGICFPRAYGGLGLAAEFQRVFDEEADGYELPYLLNVPSLAICSATLLDMGSEELKVAHIAGAIRGDEVLAQLLSEPGAGSDLASVSTRAELREGRWRVNGSKIWSTAAFAADYGLCLTRTDWSVPKHEGLTMLLLKLDAPGVTIRRIVQVTGKSEFCEVFFDDVEVPGDAVVGEVNRGWSVASRQLFHERRTMGGASEFSSGIEEFPDSNRRIDFVSVARDRGQADDRLTRLRLGRAFARWVVNDQLVGHVSAKMACGDLPDAAGSIVRVSGAQAEQLGNDVGVAIAGSGVVVGDASDSYEQSKLSENLLARQVISIGGGTTEMALNVIAERVLGMPREPAADRGIAFKDVPRNRVRRRDERSGARD